MTYKFDWTHVMNGQIEIEANDVGKVFFVFFGGVDGRLVRRQSSQRLRAGELGHRLRALRHGVLGELTRQDKADGRLHLLAGERVALRHAAELAGLRGDLVEGVRDNRVNDVHGLLRHARLRVHLLEHLEDVRVERLLALAGHLLLARGLLHDLLHHGWKGVGTTSNQQIQ